jgi:hypothetical protein
MISKTLLAKIALIVIVGGSVLLPIIAIASTSGSYTSPSLWPTGFWGPLLSCTGNYPIGSTTGSGNYCTNLCDLIGTFINVVYFVMSIGIFIITPIMLVVGSIMLMVSGANPEMLGTGKKVLTSTVIGIAIILCSYLIVVTVVKTLGITGIGGFGTSACNVGD